MTAAKRRHPTPDTPAARLLAIREALVPDLHGHRRKLAAAWDAWNTHGSDDADRGRLAVELAEAVGACVVTRTDANGNSTCLAVEIALTALDEVTRRLEVWTRELTGIGADGDDRASVWFPRRHSIWLVMEGVRLSTMDGPVLVALHATMDRLDPFDQLLLQVQPNGAVWIASEPARFWRESLQGAYRAALPWWLDPVLFPSS